MRNFGKFDYIRLPFDSVRLAFDYIRLIFDYIRLLFDYVWLSFFIAIKFFCSTIHTIGRFFFTKQQANFVMCFIFNFKVWSVMFLVAIIQPRSQGALLFLYFYLINFCEIKFCEVKNRIVAYKLSRIKRSHKILWDKVSRMNNFRFFRETNFRVKKAKFAKVNPIKLPAGTNRFLFFCF